MKISVVIPIYNESANIEALYKELSAALKKTGESYEIIYADDGSIDASYEIIKKLSASDNAVRGIRFLGRFGQTAAMSAGIAFAKGEYVVTIDGDGQNDPSEIPAMLKKLEEGFDVVSGWRRVRKDSFFTKVFPSKIANFIIGLVTGVKIHDYGCSLKIYRAQYIKPVRLYGEMHRFMPALAAQLGARITEMEVNHRPRLHGKSNYGLARTYKVILDLITVKFLGGYVSKPIYVFGSWGFLSMAGAAACVAVTVYKKFYLGIFVKDQPLFLVGVFLGLVGVQMFLMGLLAELISRTYFETQGRRAYFIKETAGGGNNDE